MPEQRRILFHPRPGQLDELLDGLVHLVHAMVERAVLRPFDPVPVREWRKQPLLQHAENSAEVALEDLALGLDRIDVGAERQASRDIDGIAHQVRFQFEGSRPGSQALPPLHQPAADDMQGREVGLHMRRVERMHDERALAAPVVAIGAEHACDLHSRPTISSRVERRKPFGRSFSIAAMSSGSAQTSIPRPPRRIR